MSLIQNFIQIFMESAPWLMLGLMVAGIMKVFVPTELLVRHLGGSGPASVTKAALLGAPLPLCSCGVIPAALGLRRKGASKSATTSFLIATPETGIDSVAISYALLGPFMAIIRPIAAIVSAIVAGLLVGRESKQNKSGPCCHYEPDMHSTDAQQTKQQQAVDSGSSCCGPKAPDPSASCCDSQEQPASSRCCGSTTIAPSFIKRLQSGIHFTCVDLVKDITLWLLIGLAFAAVITTYVPNDFLAQWGDGFAAFVVMALVGVPMYICATASTPIAAGLLFSGVSPGAVLVFMLVGPATNIATIALVKRELGARALGAYLGGVVGVGFIFAYLANYLASIWAIDFTAQTQHAHELAHTPLAVIASLMLAVLMLNAIWGKYISNRQRG